VSDKPDRLGAFTAADETKLDALDLTRLLPTFPAPGSRDKKSPVFTGDALVWKVVSPTGSLDADQIGETQSLSSGNTATLVTLADLPDTFAVHVEAGNDQATELVRKAQLDTSGERIDIQYGHTSSDALRLLNSSGVLRASVTENAKLSFFRFGAAPSDGTTAPTLANITSALGLSAVGSVNRGMLIIRKNDDTGYDYRSPDSVGWLSSKDDFAAKIKAIQDGYAFSKNAARDEVDFTAPDTTDPWPTPTKLDSYDEITAPKADSDIMEIETADGLRKIATSNLRKYMQAGIDENIGAGDGIDISNTDIVSIKPPPYLGAFWGNGQEGEPDIEILRRRDLIVDDERQSSATDITWSNGWTIRGLVVPSTGIGMLNDQNEILSPAPGSSIQGNVPAGDGAWQFTGGSSGHLVWNGTWPEHGMDLKIDIDMSDFRAGDRIHLTLTTNNNDLWGSARTPDRGQDFYGSSDRSRVSHSHIYELRPSSIAAGTQIQIHLEAILQGDPSNNNSVGLLRSANVTLTYPPEEPAVPHQVFTLGAPTRNTSIDAIGSDAWLIPVTYTSANDNTDENHLDVDSGDSVWEYVRGLNNVLMELLSHSDTTQAAWTFELWTYAEGILDWHMVRQYQMPGPTSGTTASHPAIHIYFDSGAVLDGQQFVLVARGFSTTPTAKALGSLTLDLDTNFDSRFPRQTILAKGLITTEQIARAENSRNSGQRTWDAPTAGVNRWEKLIVLVKDGNGAQHSASFDVSGWRRLDESAQMNTAVFSQPQLGANQELSRNSDGKLTYDSGSASVQVLEAWLDIER